MKFEEVKINCVDRIISQCIALMTSRRLIKDYDMDYDQYIKSGLICKRTLKDNVFKGKIDEYSMEIKYYKNNETDDKVFYAATMKSNRCDIIANGNFSPSTIKEKIFGTVGCTYTEIRFKNDPIIEKVCHPVGANPNRYIQIIYGKAKDNKIKHPITVLEQGVVSVYNSYDKLYSYAVFRDNNIRIKLGTLVFSYLNY